MSLLQTLGWHWPQFSGVLIDRLIARWARFITVFRWARNHSQFCITYCGMFFLRLKGVTPRLSPKPEGRHSFAVHDCVFSIFTPSLRIWRHSPTFATWGSVMPWWQGTHLAMASDSLRQKAASYKVKWAV
jgi:hypothetical protein